jgi:hypothetical protein
VANAFNSGVETFMKELDALAATELARARRDGNDRLVEALRDFRSTVTTKAARMVRREDGTQEVASGYGLSPNAFVQVAHAFCCFGCERLERDGYGRTSRVVALKALKDGARQLPHFYSFLSLTDLLLGGSGFLGERSLGQSVQQNQILILTNRQISFIENTKFFILIRTEASYLEVWKTLSFSLALTISVSLVCLISSEINLG